MAFRPSEANSPHTTVAPGTTTASPQQANHSAGFSSVSPDDPRLKYTTCPFMKSALKNGMIGVDAKGRAEVDQLSEVLGPFGKVTEFFARQNHTVDAEGKLIESSKDDGILDFLKLNTGSDHFDPLHLAGSKADHI
jgi:hypothetical protein